MTQNKETIEESKVIELLKSSNAEDQELGVIIAYREFGVRRCKRIFGYYAPNINDCIKCLRRYTQGGSCYFHSEHTNRTGVKLIVFDDITIYMGESTIACVHKEYILHNPEMEFLDMRENKQ